jgi:murein DD-endopeptidase MepM/ murein hydrolase activator NlpD
MGNFEVTQEYKGNAHDGLDLVGLESKEVHSTVNWCVVFANWENPDNAKQGFGRYVVVRDNISGLLHHYAHLSVIKVKVGDNVKCTDVIGIEGSTGHSTGSHCHYCIRKTMSPGSSIDVSQWAGIPNKLGIYNDGFKTTALPDELIINNIKYVKKK